MKSKATNLVELLADCPDHLCDLVLELRDLVRAVAPETTETIRWNALNYHKAHEGGLVKGAVCQIVPRDDCLHLAFIHGAFLPDPTGLLDGDRKAKRSWLPSRGLTASATARSGAWRMRGRQDECWQWAPSFRIGGCSRCLVKDRRRR